MAKIAVMNGIPAYLTSLHNAVGALEHDAEKRALLLRVKVLFIDNVQKTFAPSIKNTDPPYSLADFEQMLAVRKHNGLATHLSAGVEWSRLSWLSLECTTDYDEITTKIGI